MKSSDKYLLSFCVATYEQPLAINQLLTTFSKEFDSRIEIIIRDDSVTDETEKVIEKYLPLFPIKYIRGEKQGLDKAIIDLTNVANGRFIWWFGDDVLHSGAIGNVRY